MFNKFWGASLCPPSYEGQDPSTDEANWANFDVKAYIADRRNGTTAYGRMSNDVKIQVTFCTAPPPILSYFCVWCPEEPYPSKISSEPQIIAAEDDLVLLSVGRGSGLPRCIHPSSKDIFVYQAGGRGKEPSLRLLNRHDGPEISYNVGLLRHSDDDDFYVVSLQLTAVPWQFTLHVFNSKTGSWNRRTVSLARKHQHSQFFHSTSKVRVLGQGGLMGFVDLWRGILICDVLDCNFLPRYIPLPRSLRDNKKPDLNPTDTRDVVVLNGRIKVADCFGGFVSGSSAASIWSRTATLSEGEVKEEDWDRECKLLLRDIIVDDSSMHFELLPKLKDNNATRPCSLEGLYLDHPTISMTGDSIVYFLAKVDPWHPRAWVVAVDVMNSRLKDAFLFQGERKRGFTLSYMRCRILTKFGAMEGAKGDISLGKIKRSGNFSLVYPRKKHNGTAVADDEAMEQDTGSNTGGDNDNMALY